MKNFLRRVFKVTAYTAAGVVIFLAIAVGLFRLFLPRLPEYQDAIKGWASTAIGMQVEFSGMDARWGLRGPELAFYDTVLIRMDTQARLVAADEVRVGLALTRLLLEGERVVDSIIIKDTSLEVRQLEDGSWRIQGAPLEDWLAMGAGEERGAVELELIAEKIEVLFLQPGDERPRVFSVPRATLSVDSRRLAFDAGVRLPDDLGRQLVISATQLNTVPESGRRVDIVLESDEVDLAGWSRLQLNDDRRLLTGTGDLILSLSVAGGRVSSASAEVDFADLSLEENRLFDASGRFELDVTDDGWLVAADEFQIRTPERQWPDASLRAEVGLDADGKAAIMDIRASYLDLQDVALVSPWLSPERREQLAGYAPSGIVTNLVATVSDIDTALPRFDLAAELSAVGVAASDKLPGVRGFSGTIRANRLGGRIEIRSTGMVVELPNYLPQPVEIDSAEGTVIWRNGDDGTTILSDSIRIGNRVFDSQSNVQLILRGEESAPEIDLASTWAISDISMMTGYIPEPLISPKLYAWFQSALVDGSVPRGSTILKGPLDKFPFDNDEGRFLLEASVRDLTFRYHPKWPATEQSDMEVVLDGMRLYSVNNRSVSVGNETVDARIEIADLREPVLTIDALSTGRLETIHSFSRQSPIGDVFGGQLDRITVSGDASFTLDLTVPLKDPGDFEFTSRIRSNNGTLAIDGFAPQITDLIGAVSVSRENISTETLGARFLGRPVSVDVGLSTDPRFSVIASTRGSATATALVEELGVPLGGLISGAADYEARILFPRRAQDSPAPLTIQIDSDLAGLGLSLPEPVDKLPESALRVRADIRFMPGGEVIESAGHAENGMAWQAAFNRVDDAWDFDRGVVMLGGDVVEAAPSRGLHIRGGAGNVRLEDWLSLSRSGDREIGAADRIRSIDLRVASLHAVGQQFEGHNVRVDRSARDWLVRIDGDDAVGSVFVPYDFASGRAMVLDMERLYLPGDDTLSGEPSTLDPRKLPPITLKASDFALGDRYLGAVDARLERVAGGLEATEILTKDETFEIVGAGKWIVDDTDPLGSRTSITATLSSDDVMQTMTRLNFAPGIASDQLSALVDVSWSGGPRADFLDVLDGDVQVRFGNGQLEEVEPGAGRVFGLMSIVALPRRLSFDFRDVFSKGFSFDKIAGDFRIVDGESYTCNLSLEGPAADIGIVGRASLAERNYDQTAVVSANVGNTLPIVGAVVAGPQVAAALLVFSQIFKKPLQEVGQVYYGIGGSWDEPLVNSADASDFARHGELAGCVSGVQ